MRPIILMSRVRHIYTRAVLLVMALILLLFPSPAMAFDEVFYSGNDILYYNSDATCATGAPSTVSGSGATVQATLVQANIQTPNLGNYSQSQPDRFKGTVDKVAEYNPDFFTLNEIRGGNFSYGDYKTFQRNHREATTAEDTGVRIGWNSKKWKKITDGIEQIHEHETNDSSRKDRYALWATFQNTENGGTVSVIATHFTTRATFAPNHDRAKSQSRNLKALAARLQSSGPVMIGGDFNFQLSSASEPYSPATILGEAGIKPVFKAGEGTFVDWIFYSDKLSVSDKKVFPTDKALSDHPILVAKLEGAGGASEIENTNETANCTCSATSSSETLVGNDNEERAFRFFLGKGLSPQQAAGVVGNMKAESGVQPMRLQNTASEVKTSSKNINLNGLGWGLVQWTPPSKMVNPSLGKGKSHTEIDSLAFQLEFLWGQLTNTGIGGAANEKAAGDDLLKQTTIAGSASSFMLKFERPKDQSASAQAHRAELANEVFGKFGNVTGDTTAVTSSETSSSGCSSGGSGDVVSIAQAELEKGVKEDPVGCDRGNPSAKGSCGPEVDKYTDGTLEYWCADFVSWVFKEAGKPFTGGSSGGWRIASVSGLAAWFKSNASYTDNGPGVIPEPGDVYFMGISHTGIVEKVEGNTVYTISGNTSTDSTGNGNGVGQGSYPIGSSEIYGYGRL